MHNWHPTHWVCQALDPDDLKTCMCPNICIDKHDKHDKHDKRDNTLSEKECIICEGLICICRFQCQFCDDYMCNHEQ